MPHWRVPDAGEVRLAVKQARRGCDEIRLAVSRSRHLSCRDVRPLREKGGTADEHQEREQRPSLHVSLLPCAGRYSTRSQGICVVASAFMDLVLEAELMDDGAQGTPMQRPKSDRAAVAYIPSRWERT